jgi:HEAT repeat protein
MTPLTNHQKKAQVTRALAEKELACCADPLSERYTKHPNKHVRARAAHLAAKLPLPGSS